jgi:hypothetical protein
MSAEHASRPATTIARAALVVAACLLTSCNDGDLYGGARAKEAATAISKRIGPSRSVIDVSLLPKSMHVFAVEPDEAWEYGARGVAGPLPVGVEADAGPPPAGADARLRFVFDSIDFAVVPSLVRDVEQRTGKVPTELRLYKRDAFISASAPPVWLIVVPGRGPLIAAADGTLER